MKNVKNLMREVFDHIIGEREKAGTYTVSDILKKPLKRGNWFGHYPNRFKTQFKRVSPESQYGDYDVVASLYLYTESSWTDSPSITLKAYFPMHVDRAGKLSVGFSTRIQEEWDGDEKGYHFKVSIAVECPKTGASTNLRLDWSDLEEFDYVSVGEFEIALLRLFKEFRLRELFREEQPYIG